jgi:hypothetical protein
VYAVHSLSALPSSCSLAVLHDSPFGQAQSRRWAVAVDPVTFTVYTAGRQSQGATQIQVTNSSGSFTYPTTAAAAGFHMHILKQDARTGALIWGWFLPDSAQLHSHPSVCCLIAHGLRNSNSIQMGSNGKLISVLYRPLTTGTIGGCSPCVPNRFCLPRLPARGRLLQWRQL